MSSRESPISGSFSPQSASRLLCVAERCITIRDKRSTSRLRSSSCSETSGVPRLVAETTAGVFMISSLRNSDTLLAPCRRLARSRVWYSSCVTRMLTIRLRLTKLNGIPAREFERLRRDLFCSGK